MKTGITMPDFQLENLYTGPVCGVDEVGRGPLAGPVVAACVIIPEEMRNLGFVGQIKDSKKLSPAKRAVLNTQITQNFPYAIATVDVEEIDALNILHASLKAMSLCIEKLALNHEIKHILIDGNKLPPRLPCAANAIVKGDSRSVSIAAASIIAKVHRDEIMLRLDTAFPQFGWKQNAGYPTAHHLAAIEKHGITPYHRKTFGPVKKSLLASSS